MPSIQDAIKKSAQMKANPQPPMPAPTPANLVVAAPPQDLPLGGGLPQRGMFPANMVLASDRSDSSRVFRGPGVRSATFPFPAALSPTKTTVQVTSASAAAVAATLTLLTNGNLNPIQNVLNLFEGNGIGITVDAFGTVTITNTASSVGDGLVHGDPIWDVDSAVAWWRDDFLFGLVSANNVGGTGTTGELKWDTIISGGVTLVDSQGFPPHFGQVEIQIPSNEGANTSNSIFLPTGGILGTGTIKKGMALLDNPGWKQVFVFGYPSTPRNGGVVTSFPLTHTSFYCGLTTPANTSGWSPNTQSTRPPYFVGLRYDTSPAVSFTLSAVATGSGATTVYTGTITNGGTNLLVGTQFVISGFANGGNNGTFTCTANTTTTLTLNNPAGVAVTAAGTATGPSAIADSTFKFEVVANPIVGASVTNGSRNNLQGTVFDTGITPKEFIFYRLEMLCPAVGTLVMTLTGDDGSSATNTFTNIPQQVCASNTGTTGGRMQISLQTGNGLSDINYSAWVTGGQPISGTPCFTAGTKIVVAGATNPNFNGSFTITGNTGPALYTYQQAGTNGSEAPSPCTVVGYPALMPYFSFGTDTTINSTALTITIDFWALVWNAPGLATGGAINPAKSRYF